MLKNNFSSSEVL